LDKAKLPIHTTKRADVAYLIEMKRIKAKLLREIFWRTNNMQTDRQSNQRSKKTNIKKLLSGQVFVNYFFKVKLIYNKL